jgi:GABA(A) receptor-associated protein
MKFYKEIVSDMEKRKEEAEELMRVHCDRLPIVVEAYKGHDIRFELEQNRFLVPRLYTFHEFIFHIRRKIKMEKSESLYVVVGNSHLPAMNRTMLSIYNEFKDPDGYLYLTYSSQQVWGYVS